jgi:cellulose synthase/poly-beta-1,6-N-acetylglucosamine synthase-like glycosyltransferase
MTTTFTASENGLIEYTNLPKDESAVNSFNSTQKIILLTIFLSFLFGLLLNWHKTLMFLVAGLTILYFGDLIFNLILILKSFIHSPEILIDQKEIDNLKDHQLPLYTIFCPLYKEWEVLPQFVTAISRLNYPKDKLQVLLLLEENDQKTIEVAQSCRLPKYFEIIVVPHSLPKTKPKALNYGLLFAKGEYAVIYDAEDIPEKDQLKKAYLAFSRVDKKTICIQAKLNYYNPHQNLLTRLFAAEYSLWFDLILVGLQSIHAPIPLGGTSNHFRLESLHQLKGWDPFNVTEDCDLGIRLAKKGYHTAMMDSTTLEEANSKPLNWLRQRSRWIKGYIQTYFVHMRCPRDFLLNRQSPDRLTFQLIVGGKILSIFINPIMWLTTLSYFLLRATVGKTIESFYPAPIMYLSVFCLAVGNFLYLYYYMIGCAKREYFDLLKYVFLVPLYWLGMSLAGWKALYEIVFSPHYWAKTIHGFHINNQKAASQAVNIVGQQLVDRNIAVTS